MEELLLEHLKKYPGMQAEDALLLLYQAAGGRAPLPAEYDLTEEIEQEGSGLSAEQMLTPYFEPIGGGYCRMSLSVLQAIPAALLARMVLQSDKPWNEALFQEGLLSLKNLCEQGKTEFSAARVNKLLGEGRPRLFVHSAAFRQACTPAYRVVREEYGKYLDVFVGVSRLLYRGGEVMVAIDGPSGAGKTTLARLLAGIFGGNCFCTEEFMEGSRFDYARLQRQVLKQLHTGRPFTYESAGGEREVFPSRLNLVEGLYSLHPALEKYYEVKIFLGVSPLVQTRRILGDRGQGGLSRFTRELAPKEAAYLKAQQTELKCDFVFTAS